MFQHRPKRVQARLAKILRTGKRAPPYLVSSGSMRAELDSPSTLFASVMHRQSRQLVPKPKRDVPVLSCPSRFSHSATESTLKFAASAGRNVDHATASAQVNAASTVNGMIGPHPKRSTRSASDDPRGSAAPAESPNS